MIRNSYIFLDGISKKTESNIWKQGNYSWNSFLEAKKVKGLSKARKLYCDRQLLKSREALYNFDSGYFADKLPSSEVWRLYGFFKEEAVFLDIETSGVTSHDYITVVGLFNGVNTKSMIRGVNLNMDILKKELTNYKLIVTFNGASFDLPFIKKRHGDLLPKIPHLDLRHACAKVGLKGGLKDIERSLGIKRGNSIVESLYGGDAITLWRMFRATGDDYYLKLLVEYNEEDVINLKTVADYVYAKLSKSLY